MRCGTKCFSVTYEVDGREQTTFIHTRTPAEARKQLRLDTNGEGKIITLRQQKPPVKITE